MSKTRDCRESCKIMILRFKNADDSVDEIGEFIKAAVMVILFNPWKFCKRPIARFRVPRNIAVSHLPL